MAHNAKGPGKLDRNGNGRMKIELIKGVEAWFDVDDITIHIWASNWTGREIVSLRNGGQARVVSDKRSIRFQTPHEFDYGGHGYRLNFSVGFGKAKVELYRDGQLIDSDLLDNSGIRINPDTGRVDWSFALKKLAMPMLAGAAVGAAFGYLIASLLP